MQVSTDPNNQFSTDDTTKNVFDDDDTKETGLGILEDPLIQNRRVSVYKQNNKQETSSSPSASSSHQGDDDALSHVKHMRKAMLEVSAAVSEAKGFQVDPQARMSMQSTFPLSVAAKQWTGQLHSQAVIRGYTGYTRQEAAVRYATGAADHNNATHVTTGATAVRNRYHVYVDAQTKIGRQQKQKQQQQQQHTVSARYTQRATTEPLRGAQLSLTGRSNYAWGIVSSTCRIPVARSPNPDPLALTAAWQSKTVHPWRLSVGWNQFYNFSWQCSLSPKLSPYQTLRLAWGQVRPGIWTWSGNFGQQLRQGKSLHVALSYNASRGLLWIFSWSNGDFSLNVPISFLDFEDMWAAVALAGVTKVIQDAVALVLRLDQVAAESTVQQQKLQVDKEQAARSEALGQQGLMKRQATTRMRLEQEQQGLVIQSAIYFLSSSSSEKDSRTTLDVTIPLQFWVSDSSLELPAGSKKNLLGFFDILAHRIQEPKEQQDLPQVDSIWTRQWWTNFVRLPKQKARSKTARPMLEVVYEFRGNRNQIVVHDEEKLVLPPL